MVYGENPCLKMVVCFCVCEEPLNAQAGGIVCTAWLSCFLHLISYVYVMASYYKSLLEWANENYFNYFEVVMLCQCQLEQDEKVF